MEKLPFTPSLLHTPNCPNQTFSLFLNMTRSDVWPSKVTFASVLASCGVASQLLLSKQSSLIDVYAKCGVMIDTRRMFHEIPQPNVVTWNLIV
ncbi:hypothetical protein VIGAN_03144800 [Vigna angularis var. angularis]|uniref:Uncharacterized protein n=1 Tax=Vigna angularis var. angularis TaxID=157739 RepID=A0A0S3RMC6_PHAAN|nr:hypothetical protein VIGAN_03144800 [Vigna angularis var. angularis]